MTTEQWEKLKEIFSDALEQPRNQRDAFTRQACAAHPDLLAEVQRLLAEYDRSTGSLSTPALGEAVVEEAPPRFAPGMQIGRFRIVEFIARGGMGEVYEAEDLELHEHVALKTFRQEIAEDERALALFKSEIQLARRVTHPNVCRIYDLQQYSQDGQTISFLSMELLRGETLAETLRTHGPMTIETALPLIEQVAAGLQAAHDAGVIHRDFKPGNVMLAPGAEAGRVRAVVTDFGLALPLQADPEHAKVDRGTPPYMAPEQLEGGAITTATDVYSFGLVIAAMLGAGRQLDLPPAAAAWRGALERSLEKDPSKRYSRPAELGAALKAALKPRRRRALAAAIALAMAVAAVWIIFTRPPNESARGTMRPVWTSDDVDTHGRISPDGRLLSFIDWSTRDVSTRDVRTGEKRRITVNRSPWPDGAGDAVFSPDGRHLAYAWMQRQEAPEIRTTRADGSEARTIFRALPADLLTAADWSADGKSVLAIVSRNGSERQLVAIDPGNTRTISVPGQFRFDAHALFSPDSRYIAYDSQNASPVGGEIRLIEMATLRDTPLLNDRSVNRLAGWSPDGTRILFTSDRSGAPGLWALRFNHGQVQGEPEPLKLNTAGWMSPMGVTREGTFYYAAEANTSEVYIAEIDPESAMVTSAPQPLGQRFAQSKGSMVWSPDGSTLLFATARGQTSPVLVLHSTAGGQERGVYPQLLSLSILHKWHPNGRSVFAEGTRLDGESGLLSVDLSTGEASVVASGLPNDRPGFSKDGSTIYFMRGQQSLVARDVGSGAERVLFTTAVPHALRNPNAEPSPDGRSLVFQMQGVPPGYDSVAVLPTRGGEPRILLSIQGERILGRALAWTSDSRTILMSRLRGDRSTVWKIPAEGGTAQQIGLSMPGLVRMLRLNPDGRRLAFSNGELKDEIWAMEGLVKPAR